MQQYNDPFLHYVIPNFLAPTLYKQISNLHSVTAFQEKHSDLFHFYQSKELAGLQEFVPFQEALLRKYKKIKGSSNDIYINLFGSYYFKGDYLLVHDDLIGERVFAFSYYLQDHPSAQLILYDSTCTRQVKRIPVTQNTLVIFEVSKISYHEVAFCKENGRKAFTGWFNQPGVAHRRPITNKYLPHVPKMKSSVFPLEQLDQIKIQDFQYPFRIKSKAEEGPFFSRRVERLQLREYGAFQIQHHRLVSIDCLHFRKGDYLLLNDPINQLGNNVLDIFIFPKQKGRKANGQIKLSGEEGEEKLEVQEGCMVMVKRKERKLWVERVADAGWYMVHLVYVGMSGRKKKICKRA